MNNKISILIITGPVGVGKTVVADKVSNLLTERGIRNGVIDMDTLRWAYPRQKEDPFNTQFGFQNLKTLWPNYAGLEIRHLIIPNVIEDRSDVEPFKKAIPNAEIKVVRLVANVDVLHKRLEGRETGDSLKWHKNRALELDDLFNQKEIGDFVVENENKTVNEVAENILNKWLI